MISGDSCHPLASNLELFKKHESNKVSAKVACIPEYMGVCALIHVV